MFSLNAGGAEVIPEDPVVVREAMEALGVSFPGIENCNSIEMKHGSVPGRAYFLIRKSDYDTLGFDLSSDADVTITVKDDTDAPVPLTFSLWTLSQATVVLGHKDNPNAVVFAIFEDIRMLAKNSKMDTKTYNKTRHTQHTNSALPWYYETTLNAGALWTASEIVDDMLSSIPITVPTRTVLNSYKPLNFFTGGRSALDGLVRMAEITRTYFYVDRNGEIIFGDTEKTSYSTSTLDYGIEDVSAPHPYTNVQFHTEKRRYKYFNNESDWDGDLTRHDHYDKTYETTRALTGGAGANTLEATLPHIMEGPMTTGEINTLADIVAARLAKLFPSRKDLRYRGVIENTPQFGWDRIIYANYGNGMMTRIVCPQEHELNYYTPEFWEYEQIPAREIWHYEQTGDFTNDELGQPDYCLADIHYPWVKTNERVTGVKVYDILGKFVNNPIGTEGVCVQLGEEYYIVDTSNEDKYFTWTLTGIWILDGATGIWAAQADIHDLVTDDVIDQDYIYDRLKMYTDQVVGDRGYCYLQPRAGTPYKYWAVNAPCEHWTGYT